MGDDGNWGGVGGRDLFDLNQISEFLTRIYKLGEVISCRYYTAFTEFPLDWLTSSTSRAALENRSII